MRSIPNGGSISRQMRAALENEARKAVVKNSHLFARDFMSIILYSLHDKHGWGKKRLLDFYYHVMPTVQRLKDHYEMQDTAAAAFLCSVKLKDEVGIDIDELGTNEISVEVKIG